MNLATVLEEQQKPDEAEKIYKQAITQWKAPSPESNEASLIYSNLARGWYDYARLQIKRGLYSIALEYLQKAFANDCLSRRVDDMVRTSSLIGDVMLEMAGRGSLGEEKWNAEMKKMQNELSARERNGSPHEKKLIHDTSEYLGHLSSVFESWTRWNQAWKSRTPTELCEFVLESLELPPYPYSLLRSILPVIAQTQSTLSLSVNDSVISVSPSKLAEWLTIVTIAVLVEEQRFNQAISLLQKNVKFLSLSPVLPAPSPISILNSLKQKLRQRLVFCSETSTHSADVSMPFSEAKSAYDALLRTFPELAKKGEEREQNENEDDEDLSLLRKIRWNRDASSNGSAENMSLAFLQSVNRGNSRFSHIRKKSNEAFRVQYEDPILVVPKRRVRMERSPSKRVRLEDSPLFDQPVPQIRPEQSNQANLPMQPIPLNQSIQPAQSLESVNSSNTSIRISSTIFFCGNQDCFEDFIPAVLSEDYDYIRKRLTDHIKSQYVVEGVFVSCLGSTSGSFANAEEQSNSLRSVHPFGVRRYDRLVLFSFFGLFDCGSVPRDYENVPIPNGGHVSHSGVDRANSDILHSHSHKTIAMWSCRWRHVSLPSSSADSFEFAHRARSE